jgi:hypothetical protein
MIKSTTIELLEKWQVEYPGACKKLIKSIDIIEEQLEAIIIPTDMLVDFQLCLVYELIERIQNDTNNGELEQVRFEQLNRLMEFSWCGKRYTKFNNDFAGKKSNCKCIETGILHKFKPDDPCLIPAKFAQHQNAVAC